MLVKDTIDFKGNKLQREVISEGITDLKSLIAYYANLLEKERLHENN